MTARWVCRIMTTRVFKLFVRCVGLKADLQEAMLAMNLLSDTKTGKDSAEEIVAGESTGNFGECLLCLA